MRCRETVRPVAAWNTRLRWCGEVPSARAKSGSDRPGSVARASRGPVRQRPAGSGGGWLEWPRLPVAASGPPAESSAESDAEQWRREREQALRGMLEILPPDMHE